MIRGSGSYDELLKSVTVWTDVDPETGRGIPHTFEAEDGAELIGPLPAQMGLLAANPYSPDFTGAAIVFPRDDDHAAVIGWVTETGQTLTVSDSVVEDDPFTSPPRVSGGQFDSSGNFYFKVDETVYKTRFTGEAEPKKPTKVKVKGMRGNLFVWADGRVEEQPSHAFMPFKPGSSRGAWTWGGRDFMGFVAGGWIGSCQQYSRVCKYPYESSSDEPVYGTEAKPISPKSRGGIQNGAVDPTGRTVVFSVGKVGETDRTLFSMKVGHGEPELIDGSGDVLAWLP